MQCTKLQCTVFEDTAGTGREFLYRPAGQGEIQGQGTDQGGREVQEGGQGALLYCAVLTKLVERCKKEAK